MTDVGFAVCSRCEKRPQTPGGNKWCQPCRAEYQKIYQETKLEMAKKKGFHEGVRETKELLAREFEKLGHGSLSCPEIANYIRRAPGPAQDEEREEEATAPR